MTYDISEHRFRSAAWCASTSARASPKCRFSVEIGFNILSKAGCQRLSDGWSILPCPKDFSEFHHKMCLKLIDAACDEGLSSFTYGVSAKMLNCYFKALYVVVCDDSLSMNEIAKQSAIHPPIDRLLLTQLKKRNIGGFSKEWRKYENIGWSNFNKDEYLGVINLVKQVCKDEPLWKIENHWDGYK